MTPVTEVTRAPACAAVTNSMLNFLSVSFRSRAETVLLFLTLPVLSNRLQALN